MAWNLKIKTEKDKHFVRFETHEDATAGLERAKGLLAKSDPAEFVTIEDRVVLRAGDVVSLEIAEQQALVA